MPRWTNAIISATLSGSRPWSVATCSYGATIRCPFVYGNLLRITKQRSPRWTIRFSRSCSVPWLALAQKMQLPSASSFAPFTYLRRHGAQIRWLATLRNLEPTASPEVGDQPDQQRHHRGRDDPEVGLVPFARDSHVHAPDARDEREREHDHRDRGEDSQDVVDAVGDHRLVRVLERLDDLLVVLEQVPDALLGVDDVVEVDLQVDVRREVALLHLLQVAEYRALRADHPAEVDDLLLHVGDVPDDLLGA